MDTGIYQTYEGYSTHDPAHLYWILGQIRSGPIKGRAIIGQWEAHSLKNFVFTIGGYSNKPNA